MSDLRTRRHAQTRADLVSAALRLFAERGFASVSMDDIAAEAGVSRSTAYRRFATKEDIVLEVPRGWLAAWDHAVAGLPADTDLYHALLAGALAVADHIDADHQMVMAAYAVLAEVPALGASTLSTTAWTNRMRSLIDQHTALDDESAAIIAGAHLGAIDAMMVHWASAGGTGSVTDSTVRLAELLRPILANAAR